MKIFLDFTIFFVFFNIALFMIAAIGFFPYTVYGDATTYKYDPNDPNYDMNDPNKIPSADKIFDNLLGNFNNLFGIPLIPGLGNVLTFGLLTTIIFGVGVGLVWITKQTTIIAVTLFIYIFLLMYANSRNSIDAIAHSLDSSVLYILAMFGVGMLIFFVIGIMDYLSSQRSGSR